MALPDTLATAEERKLIERIKRAVDLVDSSGLSPDEAITKVARDDRLAPGVIDMVCRAYNTGRQLGQWRANTSILDKLASFELANADKVKAAIYPKAETKKEAFDKSAMDQEYRSAPDWIPDERRLASSRRDLKPMIKTADSKCRGCGKSMASCSCQKGSNNKQADLGECPDCKCFPCTCNDKCGGDKHGSEWRMRRAYGNFERAKFANDSARQHAQKLEDTLKGEVANLVGYLKQASYYRLPFAQIEHASRVYLGPAATDLLKMAYQRARLKEPVAAKTKIQKLAFDMESEPFTTIKRCVKLAEDILTSRQWVKEAHDLLQEVAEELRPFVRTLNQSKPGPVESEKRGFNASQMLGSALGSSGATLIGGYPKSKADLIEDDWLDLESPEHQNELRKIRTHAMLNSILTDSDDPISGNDPDKVLSAYNEIAQTAPRAADNAAILKPLLRKRLAGNVEPFEAKELVDIEKGLRDTKNIPPSTSLMGNAPESIMG